MGDALFDGWFLFSQTVLLMAVRFSFDFLDELSEYITQGQWAFAIDPESEDLGRNDPCWCASGKKFKRCHGS